MATTITASLPRRHRARPIPGGPLPWPLSTYVVDQDRRVGCCPIPGALGEELRAAMPDAGPVTLRHREDKLWTCLEDERYFVFSFVRNPWDRLVRAFLEHIANQDVALSWSAKETVLAIQEHLGKPRNLVRRLSFREFVLSTVLRHDHELDGRWRPQTCFLRGQHFDFLGRFEQTPEHLAFLCERTGIAVEPPRPSPAGGCEPLDELDSLQLATLLQQESGAPDYHRFYPADLRALVERRYAADVQQLSYSFD